MNKTLSILGVIAFGSIATAATPPVPSLTALTTGNGFGFQVFDLGAKKITQFLERPYRYLRPGADPQGLGVERRNLAYDAYFGVRGGNVGGWLKDVDQSEVGYVAESGIIRSVGTINGIKAETYYFSPFGYAGNALVMVIHVTNTGANAATIDVFANPNFHMGSGTGDTPGAENESIVTGAASSTETGPGGGAMIYLPLGGFDKADCSGGGYAAVQAGQDLGTQSNCSNNDITIEFQKSLGSIAAGKDAWWGIALQFSNDAANAAATNTAFVSWQNGRTPQQLLTDAESEWEAWRKAPPTGLSDAERAVYRQAEAVLRMAQVLEPWSDAPKQKAHGMIVASLPYGQWHIGWVRDAQYAIVALARMGHFAEAKQALNFFLDAEANKYQSYVGLPYRISITRYFGDGQEESDWNSDGPNIELDGWGLYLWAARSYVEASGDLAWLSEKTRAGEPIYGVLRDLIAAPLDHNREASGLIAKDTSIWESHWNNRKHYAFTSLAAARGLCDFAALAQKSGDSANTEAYAKASAAVQEGVRANLVDGQLVLAGSQEGLASGHYHDGAVLEAFNWSLIPPSDPVMGATLDALAKLQVASGGYMRNDDGLSSYDSNEWIVIDLHAASALRRAGRTAPADSQLAWVTSQATANQNLIPELYNTFASDGAIGAYAGAIPMVGFGAAAYILALHDRSGTALPIDCGSSAQSPDGGTLDGSGDSGVPVDGSVSGPQSTPHGSCSIAPPAPPPWLLFALATALIALSLRRRSR